jgi:hypothetical protein
MVPKDGIEPPMQGFSVLNGTWTISHYFQVLRYQAVTRATLEYVGLCKVIFGFDGYKMVTRSSWIRFLLDLRLKILSVT